ncbi:MAG: tetratricopeptide repeat protein, partial [Magnetococcales bacterium]|nr:tetratricopeptide repeat protein [Magnetococcales bacterium]
AAMVAGASPPVTPATEAVTDQELRNVWLSGLYSMELDQTDAAERKFAFVILHRPYWLARAFENRAIVHEKLGASDLAKRDYDIALGLYNRDIKERPTATEPLLKRAEYWDRRGNVEARINDLGRAIALEPNNIALLQERINALNAAQKPEQALIDLTRLLKLKPDEPELLLARAGLAQQLGKSAVAIADYNRVITTHPELFQAWVSRAELHQKLNQNDQALADYDRAAKLRPDAAAVHFNRGVLLQTLERYQQALVALDQAVTLEPKQVEYLLRRGMVLVRLGKSQEALADFDRILALQPGHTLATMYRQQITRQ